MKTKNYYPLILILLALVFMTNCSKSPTGPNIDDFLPYVAPVPEGKLPLPQHDPAMTYQQYQQMMHDLWIINNFGQYQGGDTRESLYFHDGLDIVLDNGTKIFAVTSGYVRAILGTNEYYHTMIVEDRNKKRHGWAYTHVYNFQVGVGDYVRRGTYLADVHFQGLPHIHLGRAYISKGGSWDSYFDLHYTQPDAFFAYEDTETPVIERPFYYFRNNSDSLIEHGYPNVISGDIDIVVGMRERGEYAHSKTSHFGDRLCIARIEYQISGDNIETVKKKSFDFSKIILKLRPEVGFRDYERVATVYKFYLDIHPEGVTSWDKIFSYYVITNCDGSGEFGQIDPSDQDFCWDTDARDSNGKRLFPNGDYVVTVAAYDFMGNKSSASETVRVAN